MPTRRAWLALTLLATFAGFAPAAAKNMTFETYPDAKSEYRWRLKDADGNIVATSGQGYSKKADCTDMPSFSKPAQWRNSSASGLVPRSA